MGTDKSLLKWLPWRYYVAELSEQMPHPSGTLEETGGFPLRKKMWKGK